jgi:hypothetical protein
MRTRVRRGYTRNGDGARKLVRVIEARELPSSPGPIAFLRRQDDATADEDLARALHEDLLLLLDDAPHAARAKKARVSYDTERPRGKPMRCTWYIVVTWEE